MKQATVKELAKASGVSVRTLHHYDEIGLLKPARVGANGYRYYDRDAFLRLQQILFHKEFGFSLSEIASLLDAPGFDRVAALQKQRDQIATEKQRYARLLKTIEATIESIKGNRMMEIKHLYEGFSPETQREHEIWLLKSGKQGMADQIAATKKSWSALEESEKKSRMDMLAEAEGALADAMKRGVPADSGELAQLLEAHRSWISLMWGKNCSPEAYAGLAETYRAHPDFVTRYETIAEGFCAWLCTAMETHAVRIVE